jgi:ABC-2 type transport system ATP-binding protein
MRKLGRKQLTLQLARPLAALPASLAAYRLELANDGAEIIYTYDNTQGERASIASLLTDLTNSGIAFKDLHTTQSSLEDIFVSVLEERR